MELGSIILFVKNMKSVIAFYRDVVGLSPDEDQPFPEHRFFALIQVLASCASIARANQTKGDRKLSSMLSASGPFIRN